MTSENDLDGWNSNSRSLGLEVTTYPQLNWQLCYILQSRRLYVLLYSICPLLTE